MNVTTVVTPSNDKTIENKGVSNLVETNVVRMNNSSAPIIEDWNSDNESEIDYIVRPSTEKIKSIKTGNPQQKEYKEKAVIDSGCSRHMTGNKCYLDEYEDIELVDLFPLVMVKAEFLEKNNVLFTNTECLVLSSEFKLLDKSQVLLRVLRKDNIYSVDRKSVVPTRGLTYLFAKATIDESNLWHRRLGHTNFKNMNKLVRGNLVRGLPSKIFENDHSCVACQKGKQHKASYKTKLVNSISKPLHMLHMDLFGPTNDETSGILKTFITEIENQLDHKVKVIRCDNGTEFKNSIMNQFCEMKGIKREFSVARTPQQNGVAERKNRTLISGRELFIKPHNKTPYELIRGRPPLIYFMKPFGYPITILNTRDHLGMFDRKADEGYFVGYSVIGFFDVDSLTISMNYVPVVAGNQTNGIAGTKDNIDSEGDTRMKPTEVDDRGASNKNEKDAQDTRSMSERLNQREMQTEHTNSTNSINIVSTPVSTAGQSFDNAIPSPLVNIAGPSVSTANAFEEHIFERFSPFKIPSICFQMCLQWTILASLEMHYE
ncbi:putative ribonuclease H-like domain-containing protein [Tanacetum coccineum]